MAPKLTRSFLIYSLLLVFLLSFIPVRAQAREDNTLPSLEEFIEQVRSSKADGLRGIYIPRILAGWVVQQPIDSPGFVSPSEDTLTQFLLASQFRSTGLLAHNYLAGSNFSQLAKGQVFYLVYGNGRKEAFIVTRSMRFQALQPDSPTSNFIDLEDGSFLTASQLLSRAYNRPGHVILQTCINSNGINSWGRLFVVAEPYKGNYTITAFSGA